MPKDNELQDLLQNTYKTKRATVDKIEEILYKPIQENSKMVIYFSH